MKLAVLSDLHANLHALQAVWADVESCRPDLVYCLGDLVGYGAFPNEVIEFVAQHSVLTILGNFDEAVGFDLDDCGCAYRDPAEARVGRQSLPWTRSQVSAVNKAFLRDLPLQRRIDQPPSRVLLVHGSPGRISEYLYEDRPQASFERLARLGGADVVVFGHTHLPYWKKVGKTRFVNAGSVGRPRDGDPQACWAQVELGRSPRVEFRRIAYDTAAAGQAVREAWLSEDRPVELEWGGRGATLAAHGSPGGTQ